MRPVPAPTTAGNPTRRLERVATALIVATALVDLAWFALSDMRLDFGSILPVLAAVAAAAACGLFYRTRRPDERLSAATIALAQLIAFPMVGLPLSYLAASLDRPLFDASYRAWDLALGLDWAALIAVLNENPTLATVLGVAYASIRLQMIAIVLLALVGHAYALQRFLVAYMLAALLTIAVSGWWPALGAFTHLGLDKAAYPNLVLATTLVHLPDLEALRSGAMRTIGLSNAQGIITFPSLHAAIAFLFLVSFWRVRWLRWPAVGLNLLMIAGTPIEGSHYFVDVIAGLAIAILALAAADAIAFARRPARTRARPAPLPDRGGVVS